MITQGQLLALMRNRNLSSLMFQDDPESDAEFLGGWPTFRRRRTPKDPSRFPKVPSDAGLELMRSGVFGANDHNYNRRVKKHIARRLLDRELGLGERDDRRRNNDLIAQVR